MEQVYTVLVPWGFWIVVSGIPSYKALGRTGQSRWWTLLVVIPTFGAVVVLYIVAFRRWRNAVPAPAGGARVA
jgi:hypothetical protein